MARKEEHTVLEIKNTGKGGQPECSLRISFYSRDDEPPQMRTLEL